ncbi:MAG: PocR ligand-binding domain-containing protein [Deltaproteobacteria bacterium]|nr:PocR ligand-binding domain-containing protein [Deltaproteobacteria bacterium]
MSSMRQGPGASVLQESFALAELLDLDSFKDVCASYADLFQIGFKILDRNSEMLVDVKGGSVDFCAYAFNFPEGRSRCMREVAAVRNMKIGDTGVSIHNCFTGLRYMIAPVQHEGDRVGRIVYGPYRPVDVAPPDFSFLGEKYKPEIGQRLFEQIRRVQDEVVSKVVEHLVQVIEVMLYTGYKQILTSRMHVESVTAGYTELQHKNQQLRESYERLKELDRLKSSFLATVSHELRTPLTSVIGYSEMLLEGLAGELIGEQRDYVQTIMEKGENLLSLISSILDFSKVESGNLRLNRAPTRILDVVDSAISTIMPLARKKSVAVERHVGGEMPLLRIDGEKVRQALVNLLGNAVKFNREGGTIALQIDQLSRARTKIDDDVPAALSPPDEIVMRIQIRDTGIGIPPQKIDRIFDSFYQVDSSSTREYGGTGLGLAISKSFVEAHGGVIEAQSKLGDGSTFTVLLPIEQEG